MDELTLPGHLAPDTWSAAFPVTDQVRWTLVALGSGQRRLKKGKG